MLNKNVNGLLIAAGYSSRMGEFKPLIKYRGKSFVVTIVEKMLEVCSSVVVVTGYKHQELLSEINSQFYNLNPALQDMVIIANNQNYDQGMFTSLQCGLKKIKDSDWILYHFVDQPFHPQIFYENLVKQIDDEYNWIQPAFEGKEGHPVMFKNEISNSILSMPAQSNLKLLGEDHFTKKKIWECPYPSILNDIDTPKDLESLSN